MKEFLTKDIVSTEDICSRCICFSEKKKKKKESMLFKGQLMKKRTAHYSIQTKKYLKFS